MYLQRILESRRCRRLGSALLSPVLFVAMSATFFHIAGAQEFRGSIAGAVVDAQNAPIPDATVIVRNLDTGAVFRTKANGRGDYTAPSLAPGRYGVRVEAPSFKSFEQNGIILQAGENPHVNVALQVGDVSQEIVVTADAAIVDPSNATISQVITTREVEDLPQNGRTPVVLAQLGVGVSSTNRPGTTRPFDNAGAAAISIAGTQDESTEILLDGFTRY